MSADTYWNYLRLLAREDGAPGAREARAELLDAGKTWHKDVKAANRRANAAAALRGDAPAIFLPRKTIINSKPTPNGARALAAAAKRSPRAAAAQRKNKTGR